MKKLRPSPKRRRLVSRENTRVTSFIMSTTDHERASRVAYRLRWSLAELLRHAVTDWLDRNEKRSAR